MPKKLPFPPGFEHQISLRWVNNHNLKNIDIDLPKNKIITITGVSGSGKSTLAFDTIYKEWQFRYIESLSSYLRQFFNLGTRPDIHSSAGLSPAIAIEQNKRVGNVRSSVGTLTEIDDYLRLLFAKCGDSYCYNCGSLIKAQNIDQICEKIFDIYQNHKISFVQDLGMIKSSTELGKRVKKNRKKVDEMIGFTKFLAHLQYDSTQWDLLVTPESMIVEYFYLESPNIPDKLFPIKVLGIYDTITIETSKIDRIKEDIVKMLHQYEKVGIYCPQIWSVLTQEDLSFSWRNKEKILNQQEAISSSVTFQDISTQNVQKKKQKKKQSDPSMQLWSIPESHSSHHILKWFTDKTYCATCNIHYPEFTTQHFSHNRQEGACQECHGLGQILNVDIDQIIDGWSPVLQAIIPRRDSVYGQTILNKLCIRYGIDGHTIRNDLPVWFQNTIIHGDGELYKIGTAGKYSSMYYRGVNDILTWQYNKWLLWVDFQSMMKLEACPTCHGAKLRKESLAVRL